MIPSSLHPFLHPFFHSFIHSLIHSFILSSSHSFIPSSIYPFFHTFVNFLSLCHRIIHGKSNTFGEACRCAIASAPPSAAAVADTIFAAVDTAPDTILVAADTAANADFAAADTVSGVAAAGRGGETSAGRRHLSILFLFFFLFFDFSLRP